MRSRVNKKPDTNLTNQQLNLHSLSEPSWLASVWLVETWAESNVAERNACHPMQSRQCCSSRGDNERSFRLHFSFFFFAYTLRKPVSLPRQSPMKTSKKQGNFCSSRSQREFDRGRGNKVRASSKWETSCQKAKNHFTRTANPTKRPMRRKNLVMKRKGTRDETRRCAFSRCPRCVQIIYHYKTTEYYL